MNLLKNVLSIEKLKLFRNPRRNILLKLYLNTSSCKKLTRLYSEKTIEKINICSNFIHYDTAKREGKINEKTSNDLSKSDEAKTNLRPYRNKSGLSVAIVGGGAATMYTMLLLKQNPAIKHIRMIDTDNSLVGPVCDAREIDTSTDIKHYKKNFMMDGLRNADIVALMDETHFVMGKEEPWKQFASSSSYVKKVSEYMVAACPNALIAVFVHPVTATVPLVSEIFKHSGTWNPNKIIGSAALESMRAAAITATFLNLNSSFVFIPIAGGVDSSTIVPIFSRARPFNNFTPEDTCALLEQVRISDQKLSGSEIKGPTISSGIAAAKFISTIINGIKEQNIAVANAYVKSSALPYCQYMCNEILFGPNGVKKNFGLPKMSARDVVLIERAAPLINKIVDSATYYARSEKLE